MVLSRGLVISIGVSALSCTLLFLYFRNKINSVEKKVDLMFDLIQNYEENTPKGYSNEAKNELITVSEDEEEDEDDDDDETNVDLEEENNLNYDDDSEEVSDEEEEPKLLLAEEINLGEKEIKSINIGSENTEESPNIDDIQLGEPIEDSLDELDDDDDDDDDAEEEEEEEDTVINSDEVTQEVTNDVNYKKLRVSELKALAKEKGLSNYANLKKQPLIDLLKANE